MKINFVSFFAGLIFALGLGIGGMTQTEKVIGFLDVFGNWDPTLMFVMAGAVGVHLVVYRAFRNRPSPLLAAKWHLPEKVQITPALMIGAALFGIGWALAGYCPGPALTSLASLQREPLIFVASMFAGMLLFFALDKKAKIRR